MFKQKLRWLNRSFCFSHSWKLLRKQIRPKLLPNSSTEALAESSSGGSLPPMNDFKIGMFRLVSVHNYGNKSQMSWERITRTFSIQASCASGAFHAIPVLGINTIEYRRLVKPSGDRQKYHCNRLSL